jgi:DNA/RNA-binding domain of Phe-tRNA-synthetase-like protein
MNELDLRSFVTKFPASLGELKVKEHLTAMLALDAEAPFASHDSIRSAVRDLLRQGGFKPTGRSKPASEYLIKAAGQGSLSNINPAVDICNLVSLHSGLPISVIDFDLSTPPLHVAIAPQGSTYIFNPSGQTMDLSGLLCLFDSQGPCANAVKDSQRTKTSDATLHTLTLIWGTHRLPDYAQQVETWYRQLLVDQGAEVKSYTLMEQSS